MKEKESFMVIIICLAFVFAFFVAPPQVIAKEQSFRVGHILPESMACGAAGTEFANIVAEKTNNQITIKNYFSQQLGPWQEQFDMVSQGTLDMGFLSTSPRYKSLYPLFASWTVTGWEHFYKVWADDGIVFEYTEKALDELGIKLLAAWCIGVEGISGMKGPVVLPEDIKKQNLKVRTTGKVTSLYWEDLGPVVQVNSAEVFTALQLGTVDVQADMSALFCMAMFKDVTKYYTDINTIAAPGVVIINKKVWEGLTADQQKILKKAAVEVSNKCSRTHQEEELTILDDFEKIGTKVTRLTPEQRSKWWAEAKKPGGYFDKLRKEIGDERVDFLLKVSAQAPTN
jgi:TRAP-type C4-dicarboxylate transport system substrate-binding protein